MQSKLWSKGRMAGIKGQRNPSKHRRENQWTKGTAEVIRESEVFAFKVSKELYPRVKAEIEERGISKQAFVDDLLACYYGEDEGDTEGDSLENEGQRLELSPVLRDAIETSIEIKQAALRAEKKSKRPNQGLIEKWESQIEELEKLLRD